MAQPTQPNQPQYPISTLYLFPGYQTRAIYQQASGQQAPPFDPTKPIKGWADPSPASDPVTYTVFDPSAAANVAVGTGGGYGLATTLPPMPAAQASTLNLPGVYNYPAYVSPPTDAQEVGPFGPIGTVDPNQVCLQSDAQDIANQIAPLYPGQKMTVLEENGGTYHILYGSDPRRQWYIAVGINGVGPTFLAQTLIVYMNLHGAGAPGHWTLQGINPLWVPDQPVTTPPSGAITLPVPIRALLPNEQIVHLPGSLFNQSGTWVVERTDLPQPALPESDDQQFSDIKTALAAMQTTLSAIQTKIGA